MYNSMSHEIIHKIHFLEHPMTRHPKQTTAKMHIHTICAHQQRNRVIHTRRPTHTHTEQVVVFDFGLAACA